VKKIDWGFCVVEVGKLVITMTTKKDSTKKESTSTQGGMAKRAESARGGQSTNKDGKAQKKCGEGNNSLFESKITSKNLKV